MKTIETVTESKFFVVFFDESGMNYVVYGFSSQEQAAEFIQQNSLEANEFVVDGGFKGVMSYAKLAVFYFDIFCECAYNQYKNTPPTKGDGGNEFGMDLCGLIVWIHFEDLGDYFKKRLQTT